MSEVSDDVYQPDPDGGQEGESFPDLDNSLGGDQDDMMDTGYSPPDRPRNAEQDETLDERLAEEEPEVWERRSERAGDPVGNLTADASGEDLDDGLGDAVDTDGELRDDEVGDVRSGRLVAPDEGAHEDAETDLVASDVGIDGGAASAEEAAMHVVDDERG